MKTTSTVKFDRLTPAEELTLVYHISKCFHKDNPKISFEEFKDTFENRESIYAPTLSDDAFECYEYNGRDFEIATLQEMKYEDNIYNLLKIIFLYIVDWANLENKEDYMHDVYSSIKAAFEFELPLSYLENFLIFAEALWDNKTYMNAFFEDAANFKE